MRVISYMELCHHMQTGEPITIRHATGRIIRLSPEAGTHHIVGWIVTLQAAGSPDVNVYVRTDRAGDY